MAGPGQARFYSSTFVQNSLAAGISSGATTWNVSNTPTGAPGTPFVISVDQNTASEELMLVTNISGNQFTVTRGVGGTAATSHSNGASVVHVMYAQDLTDASAHIGAYDAVHGLSSGSLVVGTTDTQTLTNKTLTSPVINTPTVSTPTITGTSTTGPITSSGVMTATDFAATGLSGATAPSRYVGAHAGGPPTTGSFNVGDFVIDTTNFTILVCNLAGSPGTWSTLVNRTNTESLSNKTLVSPTLSGTMGGTGAINISGAVTSGAGVTGTLLDATGNTGAANPARLMGATSSSFPLTGTFQAGDFVVDLSGAMWVCITGGTPGTWVATGAQGIQANPTTSTATGTATSGTTDTIDTVLGTYQFTAVAGQWYHVYLDGLVCNGSVANDAFALRVRDSGSASTPTTASTAVIDDQWTVNTGTGSAGRITRNLSGIFQSGSSGTHTLAFFAQRVSGTGVFTPLSPTAVTTTGARSLYVENIR